MEIAWEILQASHTVFFSAPVLGQKINTAPKDICLLSSRFGKNLEQY